MEKPIHPKTVSIRKMLVLTVTSLFLLSAFAGFANATTTHFAFQYHDWDFSGGTLFQNIGYIYAENWTATIDFTDFVQRNATAGTYISFQFYNGTNGFRLNTQLPNGNRTDAVFWFYTLTSDVPSANLTAFVSDAGTARLTYNDGYLKVYVGSTLIYGISSALGANLSDFYVSVTDAIPADFDGTITVYTEQYGGTFGSTSIMLASIVSAIGVVAVLGVLSKLK